LASGESTSIFARKGKFKPPTNTPQKKPELGKGGKQMSWGKLGSPILPKAAGGGREKQIHITTRKRREKTIC